MNSSERRPAVLLRRDDHPDRDEVVDLVKLLAPHDHLLVDAPQVLRATRDLGLDAGVCEAGAHDREDLGELDLAARGTRGDHLGDLGEALGVQGLKGEILQLPLDLLDPQAVSERGVDVAGLLGRATLLPLGHDRQGPHVVKPVRQLDHEHTPVARHGHEHLAHRRGLLCLF